MAVVALPALLIGGGCATTMNHAYDPATDFALLKSYAWAPRSVASTQNHLVEATVQSLADPLLAQKGLARTTGPADFLISVRFEHDPLGGPESYDLTHLSLNMYRPDGQTLIWRGTAAGSLSTDAASADLKEAVSAILARFPPGAGR